jgi:hypothetical protein
MLSFLVFSSDGVDADHFPPRHAFLIGPDETPMQGVVRVEGSRATCEKPQPGAAGLAVQVQVARPALPEHIARALPTPQGASLGLLTLHTALLPERERPYMLMLELARRQIMLLINKLEDWQLTELPPEHPILQQFELSRDVFTRALAAQQFGATTEADLASANADSNALAAQALALAVEAGEELALIQAARQLRARQSGDAYKDAVSRSAKSLPELLPPNAPVVVAGSGHVTLPGVPLVGCAISPSAAIEPLAKPVQACCDFVTMPLRWIDLEPVEGKYSFAPTDKWIEWAVRTAKLPIVAGPIIDLRPRSAPDWLFIWENDYETLRDLVFEHVQAVVTRYRRTVSRWTVASGLHVNTNFKISFEQIIDLTRLSVMLVKKLHPTAKIQLELIQPWGEYHASNKRSIPPYTYAEAVLTAGLPIDAIALRLQMGHAEPGLSTRDMLSLSAMLDRYAALEKPLIVSALGAPSAPIPPTPFAPRSGAEPEDAYEPGHWREPWSDKSQAAWMTQALAIIASKPYVQGVCWQELLDVPSAPEMPFGGLINSNGTPKASLLRLAQIRQCLREGKNPLALLKLPDTKPDARPDARPDTKPEPKPVTPLPR